MFESQTDEIRCKRCKKLLAKADMRGHLEVKCKRCGYVNNFEFPKSQQEAASEAVRA